MDDLEPFYETEDSWLKGYRTGRDDLAVSVKHRWARVLSGLDTTNDFDDFVQGL